MMKYKIEKWETMDLLVHARDFHTETNSKKKEAYKLAIQALEKTRWIPVTERLPSKEWEERKIGTEFYDCLICRPYNAVENGQWTKKQCVEKGWFDGEGFVDLLRVDISVSITHWMPLPTPPKEGE